MTKAQKAALAKQLLAKLINCRHQGEWLDNGDRHKMVWDEPCSYDHDPLPGRSGWLAHKHIGDECADCHVQRCKFCGVEGYGWTRLKHSKGALP